MRQLLEQLIARLWNRAASGRRPDTPAHGLGLGLEVVDGSLTNRRVLIPQGKRAEHIAILGRTGLGKSRLLHNLMAQDICQNSGFLSFDLHGDTTPFLLGRLAEEERRRGVDLSERLIVVDPSDAEFSIGLNLLEPLPGQDLYVQLAEFAQILKSHWHLDAFGARTEELLRNGLHALSDCRLTLTELTPLLSNAAFRAECLKQVRHPDVLAYFRERFDSLSEGMQAAYRDPILNKVSGFTVDRKFRHILGQRQSTFSLIEALDRGFFVALHLPKGRLGEQAGTFAGLLLTKVKTALFARRSRQLVTLYCDEIQNLIAYDSGLDTLLSEARKFGVSMVSANQFLEQYPPQMRAAVMAVGTHIFFQLSSTDADKIASALDGGRRLSELLKNLPKRTIIVKSGHEYYRQAVVPLVKDPQAAFTDLYNRCRRRWARPRAQVEVEIRQRQQRVSRPEGALHDWE